MACFCYFLNDWDLSIPNYSIINGVTYYIIEVRIGEVCWTVKHRFRDFVELNNVLSTDHGFSKDLLPPKKFFGNQDEAFVETRRNQLQEYLRRTFSLLKAPMPRLLVSFLKIDFFDIFYILESIPPVVDRGSLNKEVVMQDELIPSLTLLQVHALRRCLKLPRPSSQVYTLTVDCSDVLELCGNLERLCIDGTSDKSEDSNLNSLTLDFDLSVFKALKHLTLCNMTLSLLCDAYDLRRSLCSVNVNNCNMKSPADFFFCDQLHKESHNQVLNNSWEKLTTASMGFNRIEVIGDSFIFVPRLKRLDIRNNCLNNFSGLNHLQELQNLNVSNNMLSDLTSASTNLRNLTYLDLSGNQIISLKGLNELSKLNGINVSFNAINDFFEVQYVSKLPILGYIVLTGNPLSKIVDYRIKVLLEFGDAHKRIQLDHEETTQKELDRVAVLLALKYVEKEKSTNR